VSSPEFPLFSDDDGAATESPPKVRRGNAGKVKAGRAAAAKTALPVRAGSAARSTSGTAVANGLPNPLAVARLPTPVSRSTPAKTVASSALKSPGLGQSTAAAGELLAAKCYSTSEVMTVWSIEVFFIVIIIITIV